MKLKIAQFLIILFFVLTDGEPHAAIIHLQKLVFEEAGFVKSLKTYVIEEERENRIVPANVKSFLFYIEPVSSAAVSNPHYAENPINAFHLINRLTNKWKDIFDTILCDDCEDTKSIQEFKNRVTRLKNDAQVWPTENDVRGVSRAIFRLWIMYELNSMDLFDGKILDEQTEPLSPSDVLLIARVADEDDMYYYEMQWLEDYMKYVHFTVMPDEDTVIQKCVRALAGVYNRYGMPSKALEILEPYLESGNKGMQADYEFYERHKNDISTELKQPSLEIDKDIIAYNKLCRGDIKTTKAKSKLKCFFRETKIPYYKSKEEVVNYFPRISMFHDVISEREATIVREAAKSMLEFSTVVGLNEASRKLYRVSNTAWLNDTEHTVIRKMAHRIRVITGLNTEYREISSDTEKLQVLNYGSGGMYRPHLDALGYPIWGPPNYQETLDIVGTGDRIATWLFYLSDVKAGGATVFPRAKARVPVVKGSAAFWYNYTPSGESDWRTFHAGCPVLLGSKWVANKWIRQHGNVFTRLCGLTENSEDKDPVI